MPLQLLHSVAIQEKAVSSDGVEVFDLAVNPLSVVLIAIRPLNDTGTLANYPRYLDLVGSLNRVSIFHRGASVFSMSGRDAAALNYLRHGIMPRELNPDDTNNERRCVILPILLGRFAFDPDSCFPASHRGELTMELDIDVADTGYDTFRYSVETIELLGASPKEFERKTTVSKTFAATGEQDFDLPNGNLVRGIMLFGTTGFTGAAPAPTWGRFQVLLDNQQFAVASSDIEVHAMVNSLMGRQPPALDLHSHQFEPVAGIETSGPFEQGMGGWENYAFLDFDPLRDDTFSLQTSGSSSFLVRANVETADAARVVLVEKIKA